MQTTVGGFTGSVDGTTAARPGTALITSMDNSKFLNPAIGATRQTLSKKVILASIVVILAGVVIELAAFSHFSSFSHDTVHAQPPTVGNVSYVTPDEFTDSTWYRTPHFHEVRAQPEFLKVASEQNGGEPHVFDTFDLRPFDDGFILLDPAPQSPFPSPPAGAGSASSQRGGSQRGIGTLHEEGQVPEIMGEHVVTYEENGTAPVGDFTARDRDNDSITWSLLGYDRKKFVISEVGVLSFRSPPDYENPEGREGNTYWVTLQAEDDGAPGGYDRHDVWVIVKQVNELGDIDGDIELSVSENHTGTIAQYQVEDPERGSIRWSLTGADAQGFEVDGSGNLASVGALDFETPSSSAGSNVHELTITATDNGKPELSVQINITVTVTDSNEAPVAAAIPPFELKARRMSSMVDLREYFTDPDGDALAYEISGTSNTDVAHVAVDGNRLTITPAGEGNSAFYMVAADPGGLHAISKMSVMIAGQAPAPTTATAQVAAATTVPNTPSTQPRAFPSPVEPKWVPSEHRYLNLPQQPDGVSRILVEFALEPVDRPMTEVSPPLAERPAPPPPRKSSIVDAAKDGHPPAPHSAPMDTGGRGLTIWLALLMTLMAIVPAGIAVRMYVIHRL